jgi:3',5'-cyclic AMP phosphodiesterase CpdA
MPLHLLPRAVPDEPTTRGTSRRAFLAGLALGGAAALGTSFPVQAEDPSPGDWYAWVSDIHIAADPATRNRGETMADNLRAVVAEILAQGDPPRGVFIDGDLALKDGQAGDYRTLVTLLEPLRKAGLPLHLALGNHDDRGHFRDDLRDLVPAETRVVDREVGVVEGPGLRFLVLDSLITPDSTPGRLGSAQLDWLAQDLDAHPGPTTLVFVHHNPSVSQPTALLDTEALLEVVRPRRQVKALVFGHTHVLNVRKSEEDGLTLINLPAVAYPFAPTQPLGWCRFRPEPGGGTLELHCVGGNRKDDRQRLPLHWRDA